MSGIAEGSLRVRSRVSCGLPGDVPEVHNDGMEMRPATPDKDRPHCLGCNRYAGGDDEKETSRGDDQR